MKESIDYEKHFAVFNQLDDAIIVTDKSYYVVFDGKGLR